MQEIKYDSVGRVIIIIMEFTENLGRKENRDNMHRHRLRNFNPKKRTKHRSKKWTLTW